MPKTLTSPRNREECSLMNLGGAVVNQESIGRKSLKYSDFSLAELWEAPIGGLLLSSITSCPDTRYVSSCWDQ